MNRVRKLQCCCCGSETYGRQWWNRDAGFGLCPKCADFLADNGRESPEEMEANYGVKGINYFSEREEAVKLAGVIHHHLSRM